MVSISRHTLFSRSWSPRSWARRIVHAMGLQPAMGAPYAICPEGPPEIAHPKEDGIEYAFLAANPADLITREHLAGHLYEREERAMIRAYFPSGAVFVDIGANIGNHAIWAARTLNPARVIAFEPTLGPHTQLCVNVLLNDLRAMVDVRKVALSRAAGTTRIANSLTDFGNSGRSMIHDGLFGELVRAAPGDAELAGIDDLFLKIDVEGHEIEVLTGLSDTIARCRPRAFVEVDDDRAEAFQSWMGEAGYAVIAEYRRYSTSCNFLIASQNDPAVGR